jgi:hypothetical protein
MFRLVWMPFSHTYCVSIASLSAWCICTGDPRKNVTSRTGVVQSAEIDVTDGKSEVNIYQVGGGSVSPLV